MVDAKQGEANPFATLQHRLGEAFGGPGKRVTLRLPGWLHRVLVAQASREQRSLNDQILNLITEGLTRDEVELLREAATTVWVGAVPDPQQSGHFLVSARAVDRLREALEKLGGQ